MSLETLTGATPARFLLVATLIHVALTAAIFTFGRAELLPATVDRNGNIVSIAPDTIELRNRAIDLSAMLWRAEFGDWLKVREPAYAKLYSICFALFGPILGANILSAEPLNLFCYLAILMLVFKLGRDIFGNRTGLLAASIVAIWPSFLLHTTQLLRDQFFVAGMLAFIWVIKAYVTRTQAWQRALLLCGGAVALAALIWVVRQTLYPVLIATVLIGAALWLIRQIRERRFELVNAGALALTIVLVVAAGKFLPQDGTPQAIPQTVVTPVIQPMSKTVWGRIGAPIATSRLKFILMYPDAGSNIDADVQFTSTTQIVRYLPRAALIGFFAPFPNMWLAPGKRTGSAARVLTGIETLMIYLLEGLALYGAWRNRRKLAAWLLLLVSAVGMLALGLVVINVGALYRIRYLFLVLVIILAADAALKLAKAAYHHRPVIDA